jgi:hypothetical protein
MQAKRDRVIQVVGVGEAIPHQEELVGAGAIGVEELAVGCERSRGGHREVGALAHAPLFVLFVLLVLAGGGEHLDGDASAAGTVLERIGL